MDDTKLVNAALQKFTMLVTAKMTQIVAGEPEDQLRAPFEGFMSDVASALGWNAVCTGETPLPDRLGRPDYAVHRNDLLAGYVELKAPGVGAVHTKFQKRNRAQFNRFSAIPNILYTDGNEWALYRSGERVGKVVRLSGDIAIDGKDTAVLQDTQKLVSLLRKFFLWEPIMPTDHRGKLDLNAFAMLLAPLCRMLRDDVRDALKGTNSPIVRLAQDWRQLLFPDATDEEFADAYAQTAAFALLLGRSEGADPLTLQNAKSALFAQHSLLSRALEVLTDPDARVEIAASLDLLLSVIAVVPPDMLKHPQDPWLYFYEDFLAAYDPELRRNAGVYYTPIEVVRAQVRLIDDLLVNRLNKPLGFADPEVVTLDPAVGTGTYLLGIIEHALARIGVEQGDGAIKGQAVELAKNLHGFEIMVGPYAVSELRVSRALCDRGASLPPDGLHVYLTDTLENPEAEPKQSPLFLEPIAEQHAKALELKSKTPVIICLGNPPYDRHEAAGRDNEVRPGKWVRWGDDGKGRTAILRDFLDPATTAGHGVHVKNLYNLYVYFWRWALWKVFEHQSTDGAGIVSFISASSYLDGDAFSGMREHMRRICDEIWILDLGGEGRGARRNDNVFDIQTPVAIGVAFRSHKAKPDAPADVRYARIEGRRKEKLAGLSAIDGFASVDWKDCPDDWQAPFLPSGEGEYFCWPFLTDLMPWQHSGSQVKRTWPIGPDKGTLEQRWQILLTSPDRAQAFKTTRDRTIYSRCLPMYTADEVREVQPALYQLPADSPVPLIQPYAYRSFDRQWIIADTRLGDYLRPVLWQSHSERQVYLTSLLTKPLGKGPALAACAMIPDLDHFSGRGAKDSIPLYRTHDTFEPNVLPGLLDCLSREYERELMPEDLVAYVYGILAQPAFTECFMSEVETRGLRVPLTKDGGLFEQVRNAGARLLWLHTYGERFSPGYIRRRIPPGTSKCVKAISDSPEGYPETFEYDAATRTLRVGDGEIAPVDADVYEFEISGLRVVQSWLKYRMKKSKGRKSSPLDDIRPEFWTSRFTTELLELLWMLAQTIDCYANQAKLLDAVTGSECFRADELPPVPQEMRKAPAVRTNVKVNLLS